ncbi:MAG: hypothetical protein HC856_05795 [Pseudanabaena sp. RU_4_16]|nr:hypothetical protein [Pseudanabaena sp. RU_4_16]
MADPSDIYLLSEIDTLDLKNYINDIGLGESDLSILDEVNKYPPSASPIYRFFLQAGASALECREFKRNVEIVKQANPQWEVIPDWPQTGEEEAITMIYKGDGNYLSRRAAYIVNQSLSSVLQGSYDRY